MEFQEKVCRTCLNSGFPLSSLNVKLEDQMQGRKMLEFLLGSTIDACETFSEICEPCRKKLIFCYTFKIQCLSSEEKIKQYTKVVEVVLPDPLGVNSEEVPLLIPKVEIEEEEDHQEAFEDSTNVGPEELPLRVPEEQLFEQRQAKKKTYRCGRCDIRFPDKQGYNKHFYREHFRRASTVKSNVLPRVKPAVPVATLREPLVQLREVETRKYRRCKKCNIGFPDKRSYNRHFYREHYCKGKARRAYTSRELQEIPDPLNVLNTSTFRVKEESNSEETPTIFLDTPPVVPQKSPERQPVEQGDLKIRTYRCGRCDIRFPNKQGYNKHFYRYHFTKEKTRREQRVQQQMETKLREIGMSKSCHSCKVVFPDRASCSEHYRNHHADYVKTKVKGIPIVIPRTCYSCNLTFPNGESLYMHNRDVHSTVPPVPSVSSIPERIFTCRRCFISFPDVTSYNTHIAETHRCLRKNTTAVTERLGRHLKRTIVAPLAATYGTRSASRATTSSYP